jgi:hypothetical protein
MLKYTAEASSLVTQVWGGIQVLANWEPPRDTRPRVTPSHYSNVTGIVHIYSGSSVNRNTQENLVVVRTVPYWQVERSSSDGSILNQAFHKHPTPNSPVTCRAVESRVIVDPTVDEGGPDPGFPIEQPQQIISDVSVHGGS